MVSQIKLRQYGVSTAIRNSERIPELLSILDTYFSCKKWTNENQEQYQIRLIQHKLYKPNDIPETQSHFFDGDEPMTWEQANEVWKYQRDDNKIATYSNDSSHHGYRGRMTANPLKKLGLWYQDENDQVIISEAGKNLIHKRITAEDAVAEVLLKYQLPMSKKDSSWKDYNLKPLVATLHLIKKVNKLCKKNRMKEKGISKTEYDIFVHTLKNNSEIEKHAKKLISFRKIWEKEKNQINKRKIECKTILELNYELSSSVRKKIYEEYLGWEKKLEKKTGVTFPDWVKDNPNQLFTNWNNLREYGDNLRRYSLMSGWISVKHSQYIQLKESLQVETNSLLEFDDGSAKEFNNNEEYVNYVANPSTPIWPWKTKEKLSEIYLQQTKQVKENQSKIKIKQDYTILSKQKLKKLDSQDIESEIEKFRPIVLESNLKLQTKELESVSEINEIINSYNVVSMKNDSVRKAPVELEYQTTRGLLALNDGNIMPNYPKGIDGEPTSHAGGGKPDIECFYDDFNMVCEVTLLKTQDQWKAEGTSVPDHFEQFIQKNKKQKNFCLFIAPQLHQRTVRLFYTHNQWEEKEFGRTIALTMEQFKKILETLKILRESNKPKGITHKQMNIFYQKVVDSMECFESGRWMEWQNNVGVILDKWIQEIIA
jgi:hypothetical protein